YLSVDWFLSMVKNPLLAAIMTVILTQVFHKMISNVSAAVVTLIPITISVATTAGVAPLGMAFTAGVTCLYGFMLRSEEHTSELQSRFDLVCRLLLEKKNFML